MMAHCKGRNPLAGVADAKQPALKTMSTIPKKQLAGIISAHDRWITGESLGKKACLAGANLADADLAKANLAKADLTNANLSGAVLNRANLSKVTLDGCLF
jgi:uncharacterized protein YjbI with pentapeptide repeats